MIESLSNHYPESKRIKSGQALIHPDFAPLAGWMDTEYGITVLNITYWMGAYYEPKPILSVCVELHKDASKVRGNRMHLFRDDVETAIRSQFSQRLLRANLKDKYDTRDLTIFLDVFEEEAFFETCQKITDDMLNTLRNRLSASELWKIERVGNLVTFFVHTDEQLKKLKLSSKPDEWKKAYLDILHPLDEFNYLNQHNISLRLDSRENFQNNFGGSMQYYYRDK